MFSGGRSKRRLREAPCLPGQASGATSNDQKGHVSAKKSLQLAMPHPPSPVARYYPGTSIPMNGWFHACRWVQSSAQSCGQYTTPALESIHGMRCALLGYIAMRCQLTRTLYHAAHGVTTLLYSGAHHLSCSHLTHDMQDLSVLDILLRCRCRRRASTSVSQVRKRASAVWVVLSQTSAAERIHVTAL